MTDTINYAEEYDNSGRVENSGQLIENYVIDASLFREADGRIAEYDISYGPRPRNKMDIFWPATDEGKARKAPLVMFIHGGYWQRMDKSAFSHMARGLNRRNIAVAIPAYTLCPDITINGIITEMRRACLVLYQRHSKTFAVSGHSAGGHLAACMMATDWEALHSGLPADLVTSGMGISGLYDLLPLLQSPVNDTIQMDEEQAELASPLGWVPGGLKRFQAWVGGDESGEYHRQSRQLARHWSLLGTPTDYVSFPQTNHLTVIDGLTDPESPMTKALVDLVENPVISPDLPEPDEKAIAAVLASFDEITPDKTADTLSERAIPQKNGAQPDDPRPDKKQRQSEPDVKQTSPPKREQPKASIAGKAPQKSAKNKPAKNANSKKTKATAQKQG